MSEQHIRTNPNNTSSSAGRLKIFLGYAAGVGKTYRMLEAALQRKDEGVDVIAGLVETHNQEEIEALINGLESVPPKIYDASGRIFYGLNVDAILTRRPQLVIVDDLAATNAPDSRQVRRYQEALELLSAGINVYTAIDIQNFESLKDVIYQITGVHARDTVPDRILEEANEIELVDLPPDELLHRLKEGKINIPQHTDADVHRFYRKGNLTALRELTMRRAAELVDSQMRTYMVTRAIPGSWPAGERVLICVSSHPLGERLVRAGRRLAGALNAEWFVVFVETPGHSRMTQEQRDRLYRTLRLAEQLGAKIAHINETSVGDSVISYAREQNITHIVIGKPYRPPWFKVLRGSVSDQIIRKSGKVGVYIVSEVDEHIQEHFPDTIRLHSPVWNYIASVFLVGVASLISIPVHFLIEPSNLVMLYLATVVVAAVFLGRGPSMLASFLSVLMFDFFFVDPRLSLSVEDTQYLITFLGLLAVGLIISNSSALLRDQVERLKRQEFFTNALNSLSRDLTGIFEMEAILASVTRHVNQTFGAEAAIFLHDSQALKVVSSTSGFKVSESEETAAGWAFNHGQPSGLGTETIPHASALYLPLKTIRGSVGVLGIQASGSPEFFLNPEKRQLLEGFANLAALAIERAQLAEQARQMQILKTTERLQSALLNSISHELRTPLVSITGTLSILAELQDTDTADKNEWAAQHELIDTAYGEAQRLNRLVGNLLDMTRLETGAFKLIFEPCDIQDLLGIVLAQYEERRNKHPVRVEIGEDLPLVSADVALLAQAILNLLDNATKYSGDGSAIDLSARQSDSEITIAVADRGIGIQKEDLEKVFEKFYRVQNSHGASGIGLGLSISKGIIEAHGGQIWAQNRPGGGTIMNLTVPIDQKAVSKEIK